MSMESAYSSWINVKQILDLIGSHPVCRENIERFLISHANRVSDKQLIDELFLVECERKNIKCDMETILNMHMILKQRHKVPKALPFNCLKSISSNRMRLLLSYPRATRYDVLKTYLKYDSCLPGGQQWSIPEDVYRLLVEDFGVTIEAFASPFNSQIIRFGHRYCSMFREYDSIFGSLGSFFEYVPPPGTILCVNPPFILDIVNQTVLRCLDQVQKIKDLTYILVLPNWTDADFYGKIQESPYNRYMTVMERGKYTFTFRQSSKEIVCNVLFAVIGNHSEVRSDYSRILDQWAR